MSLEFDPVKTALVVIDMTKRIFSIESMPHPIQEVLEKTTSLANAFRHVGSFVVLVRVYSVDGKDVLKPITDQEARVSTPSVLVQRSKDWSEMAPELGLCSSDHLVTKHQWGAFFGTDLDLQMRRRGIETIVLCGIATNIGVETTAREAYQYGYNQIFATDAMNAYSEEEHIHTCTYIFPRIGRVRSTDEILQAINREQK
jgi:nicotinamidase-related amidase